MRPSTRFLWSLPTLVLALCLALAPYSVAQAKGEGWYAAWGTSQQGLDPTVLANTTLRMIARPTLAGTQVRVTLQNTFGASPLVVGSAKVGVRINGAQLAPASNTAVMFGGSSSVTIPAGGAVTSDPVDFSVQAWQDIAVSLYLPGAAGQVSRHSNARKTSYLAVAGAGDHTADESAAAFTLTTTSMLVLAAIDVRSAADGTIVFFGDSITDGTATTTDGHDRWHDIFALRLILDEK